MPRVRCPKCATVVEVAPGETPVCPTCGFGTPPGGNTPPPSTPPPAPVSGPATPPSPAPLAGPSDPWGPGQSHPGYGAPTTPGAAVTHDGGEPGQVRHPFVIVLLYVVTLGIYGLVWHWKTGVEVDRFRPEARASGVLKGHVWTAIATLVLIVLALAIIGGALFSAFADAIQEERDPTGDEVWDAVVGASVGIIFVLLAVATSITSEVLKLIGMWRVWNTVAREQRRIGVEPLKPVMLLMFLLSPILSEVVQMPFALVDEAAGALVGLLLTFVVLALLIVAYVLTQLGLNQVWRAHGAR